MTAIVDAARSSTVYAAALAYARMGFSVLPCVGKQPAITRWQPFQKHAASAGIIRNWHESDLLHNVGIICGEVSRGLVVIDLDGDAAVEAFKIRFPELLNTYTVQSGSGHGLHLYYKSITSDPHFVVTTRVTGTPFGNIELRANGCYVVAPPSIHPASGQPYRIANDKDIGFVVGELRPVIDWIKVLMKQKHGGKLPPPAGKVYHATPYGIAALRGEADKVRRANEGARNNTLYEAALRLGSLIRDGKIGRARVEQELLAAATALSETDGEAGTRRTITSGINRGMESSRERH